ncbi:glycosyltransferase family 39 protein [Zavarzinella formosa]|uniref:glycosyltransferase family 39 protein n=1 Tax=Zavarzinella formosa TaxID=360055 RepID=UPI0002F046D9|nr:glycosyltransferase family 39 protein [Zavarzinella formosa]
MTFPPPPTASRRTVVLALFGITLLSIGLRWWMVAHTVVPSRDCLVFVRIAMQLYDPPTSKLPPFRQLDGPADVLRETDQPPGYPLAILGMAKMLGDDLSTVTADQMILAAQLVSLFSGVLLIFPMFGVASRVFGPVVGLLACLWYQVLPVFVEVTSDGLSDGLFLLTSVSALWFGLNVFDRVTWKGGLLHGLLAGVCVGAGYLVRPDSLIVGLAIGLMFAATSAARWIRRESGRVVFLGGIGVVVGTVLLMSPYVSIIGKITNKPAGQKLTDTIDGDENKPTYFERHSQLPVVRIPFAAWWDPNTDGNGSRVVWGAKALGSEFLKGAHYLLPFFAILGIFLSRRRWTESPVLLLMLMLGLHMGVLWYLAVGVGYVSQRHTLLSVMVAAIFAASFLPAIGAWGVGILKRGSVRFWMGMWVLVILGSCLPRDFQKLHAERAGHREAGEWIRREGDSKYPVVDPFGWTEFYSGRTVRGWTTATNTGPFMYSVIEPNAKSHHSRLPWLELADKLAARGEIVFQYPADASPKDVKVAVYRSTPLKPGE